MPTGPVAAFAAASGPDAPAALAAVVARVADQRGVDIGLELGGARIDPDPSVLAVDIDRRELFELGPWLPGMLREALTGSRARRRSGVHHTDPGVARGITRLALADHDPATVSVGDPAVGGGAFLLAAAELLEATGPRAEVVSRLRGVDIDPLAVAVTRSALELWAGQRIEPDSVMVADFVLGDGFGAEPVDVVVGNPPFLGQLREATTRSRTRSAAVRDRWPGIGGYVDEGALFFLAGLDAVAPGGSVALIQPVSVLSTRDACALRARLLADASVTGFWLAGDRVFRAGVDTCAIVVSRGAGSKVRRVHGPSFELRPDGPPVTDPDSWAALMADLIGVPTTVRPDGRVRLGDVARCTAGFRDQYYGLRDAVVDEPDRGPKLVTSGLIDPLDCRWGRRNCRFDRRSWCTPTVVLDRIADGIASWIDARLRPKLVAASQTRVLEVAVDEDGCWVPGTPVVSIEPGPSAPSLWHLAAALTAPSVSAWLAAGSSGSALSRDALRVSASTVAGLPLPLSGSAWDDAADAARQAATSGSRADLETAGRASARAYGPVDDELFGWWVGRLPTRDGPESGGGL